MSREMSAGKRGRPRKHPGIALGMQLEDMGMTKAALARATGYSRKHISELVSGGANFSAESAIKIGRATGTDGKIWLTMQAAYDFDRSLRDLADWRPAEAA